MWLLNLPSSCSHLHSLVWSPGSFLWRSAANISISEKSPQLTLDWKQRSVFAHGSGLDSSCYRRAWWLVEAWWFWGMSIIWLSFSGRATSIWTFTNVFSFSHLKCSYLIWLSTSHLQLVLGTNSAVKYKRQTALNLVPPCWRDKGDWERRLYRTRAAVIYAGFNTFLWPLQSAEILRTPRFSQLLT